MELVKPNARELGYIAAYGVAGYLIAGIKQSRTTKSKVIGVAISASPMLAMAAVGYYRD